MNLLKPYYPVRLFIFSVILVVCPVFADEDPMTADVRHWNGRSRERIYRPGRWQVKSCGTVITPSGR